MLTFQLERAVSIAKELEALALEHWEDVALDKDKMPFGLDILYYEVLDKCNMLQTLTARRDGVIVGYCLVVIRPHPHNRTVLCGFEDAYFLATAERKGRLGLQLLKESLKALKRRGVKKVFFHSKCHKDLAALFKYLKFKHCDEVWSFWLEDLGA